MDKNTVIAELPRVQDIDEFDRTQEQNVVTDEIPEVDKRYTMFIMKKKNLNLPLTYQEQKIINIIA